MTDSTTTANDTASTAAHTESPATGFLPWLRRTVSFALVVAGLGGVAHWGHLTDWTFARLSQNEEASTPSAGLARVRVGNPLPTRPDVPSSLRNEVVIEFDSADAVDEAGIAIAPAWPGAIADVVEAPGEIQFDPTLVTRVAPRATGSVWCVLKKAGDPVTAGEVLAIVEATEAGKAKADFQRALVQVRLREQTCAALKSAAKVVSTQSIREAEAAVKAAETRLLAAAQALANLDLPITPADYRNVPLEVVVERMRLLGVPSNTPGLTPNTATTNLIPVRAPFAGLVLSTHAVTGEVAEPGKAMFTVADPRRVWLVVSVRADDAGRVKLGRTIRFRTDGASDVVEGRVDWIAPQADESTRTVPVRTGLHNEGGRLRAGTLGQGHIIIRQEKQALLVPHAAVQTFRGTPVVFVRHPDFLKTGGPKAFTARPVWVGAKDAENVEILGGLERGEVVATKGSELLLNELTRAIGGERADQARGEETR